jgi:glucosamine-phosphate N-acetyltransferase
MNDIIIRKIEHNDYYKNYLELINSKINYDNFKKFINELNNNHIILVIEKDEIIIGTCTLFIEKKLTYNLSKMGHIENILIDESYRYNGYGIKIVDELLKIADQEGCYRVDLSCEEYLEKFYEKNKFKKNQIMMSRLFNNNFK